MTPEPLPSLDLPAPYHIGIVVKDIEKTIERYQDVFGIREWRVQERRPGETQPWHWHGEPQPDVGMIFAYSVTDFPLIELVQPTTDAKWSATEHLRTHGEGIYHLGYSVDDVEGIIERASRLGVKTEAYVEGEHGVRVAYLDPDDAHGVRIELVSSDAVQGLLQWVETGSWPAG